MKKLRTTLTTSVASLGLVVGLASFAGATSGTIGTTGPDSYNLVEHTMNSHVRVTNNNDVSASNENSQHAASGGAAAFHNTTAGGARTGNASNANALNASVAIDNTASAASRVMPASSGNNSGTINNTGPNSHNVVRITTNNNVHVENNNNLNVTNSNYQTATSGDAEVSGNTTGGSATTGNASNTNSTTLSLKVSN